MYLFDEIKNINQTNAKCIKIKNALKRNDKIWNEMLLKNFKNVKNTLFYHDKLWILTNESRLDVIQKVHNESTIKHSEIKRIYKFVKRLYYWSEMKNFIEKYIRNCHVCKRFKVFRDRYFELLKFSFHFKQVLNRYCHEFRYWIIYKQKTQCHINDREYINENTTLHILSRKKWEYVNKENNTITNQSCVRSTRITQHYHIEAITTIYIACIKIDM